MTVEKKHRERRSLMREIRSRHPGLREALLADARVTAAHRAERHQFHSRADAVIQVLRLIWVSDAFLAQALYRVKARLQTMGVGRLRVGAGARIGANAVIVDDVAEGATAVGVPARAFTAGS